jgi:hypothetical protein
VEEDTMMAVDMMNLFFQVVSIIGMREIGEESEGDERGMRGVNKLNLFFTVVSIIGEKRQRESVGDERKMRGVQDAPLLPSGQHHR